jgi:hypothetical protein
MEASAAQVAGVIRFGVFELDVRSGELRRSGVLLTSRTSHSKFSSVCWSAPASS